MRSSDLLPVVRETALADKDPNRKRRLGALAEEIANRLASGDATTAKASTTNPPAELPAAFALDSDHDGVPDVRDKYPTDDRRVENIPIREIKFAEKHFGMLPLRDFAPEAKEPQFLTIDDLSRAGYLVAEIQNGAAAFRVVSSDGINEHHEWILPNPGTLAGVAELVPAAMIGEGTVVGTAMWSTEAVAADQTASGSRLKPGCGFIFKDGKLTLDASSPFSGSTLRSTFKNLNQRGEIFGYREELVTDASGPRIRTVAFFGKHSFRNVEPFEVVSITETGCLLGYRETQGRRENFIWDGSHFIPIEREGFPLPIKLRGMNAKLQVIGELELGNRGGGGTAFFWEKSKMLLLSTLIPGDQRMWLQSVEPLMISDSGSITLTAELPGARRTTPPQRYSFRLSLREKGENLLELLRGE